MSVRQDTGWDLAVYNKDGQLMLVVQVKGKLNASPQWASQLRSNILAHGIYPKPPYFLMVFPDKFYLWANEDAQLDMSEPTYAVDARPIIQPYLDKAGITLTQTLSSHSLELIVASWLSEIIYCDRPLEETHKREQWLLDSGLYAAISGGSFNREAVA
ncbi:hypothetical protein WA1_16790 [Scytonema hofmannii PCC 7110]|uniref:Uncharacterized protein n=1 Tax=Scytonema hofmannii PCC 7110 TaxID=128403 RepID=A0A139XAI1_9CYAN|nr:hypothetical protein [Scytonema hofmannii]KYC41695.1 hypothetical protein WA1_16790 [Scytonema hofmannii PCC 7110]